MPPDEERPVDPLPALIAEIDQALKMAGEMARVSRAHYDAYREEGFSDKQALYLTACFFRAPDMPGDDS
jgi:hypothetical protein